MSRQIWGDRGFQSGVGNAEEQEDIGENIVDEEVEEQEEDTDDKMMLKLTKSSETPSDLKSFQ